MSVEISRNRARPYCTPFLQPLITVNNFCTIVDFVKETYKPILTIYFAGLFQHGDSTCVLESDFGFILNCAFKKSGLFRVRNLGGVKASIGLGKSFFFFLFILFILTIIAFANTRTSQSKLIQII